MSAVGRKVNKQVIKSGQVNKVLSCSASLKRVRQKIKKEYPRNAAVYYLIVLMLFLFFYHSHRDVFNRCRLICGKRDLSIFYCAVYRNLF